jgi:hypothetical protein
MRWLVGAALTLGLVASACLDQTLTGDPQLKTFYIIMPGNDTVAIDVASGNVTSGPMEIFADASVSGEFFMENEAPDPRVTPQDHQLNMTPANTSIVTFTREGPFNGTFQRVGPGTTTVQFTLIRVSDQTTLFNLSAPIEVH